MGLRTVGICDWCELTTDIPSNVQRYGATFERDWLKEQGWEVQRNNFLRCPRCKDQHAFKI